MHIVRVFPEQLRWRVVHDRSRELIDALCTKGRAIDHAREVAASYGRALVVVHRHDGSIEEVVATPEPIDDPRILDELGRLSRFSVASDA